jgi:carboxymethylenebutenolidase
MCFDFDALPPRVPEDRVIPRLAGGAAAERLTLHSADGTPFAAALAECPDPIGGPAVIILPDVRGLYRFYVDLAERFVTAGYHAIAIDYFGRTAGDAERDDEFDYMPHTMQTTPAQVQADIAAARDALAERTGATSFVTLGFCFGGADAGNPPEDIEAFAEALNLYGVTHEIYTYPGAPHSFFDRSYEEHAEASADAWRRVLDFLGGVGAGAAV